VVRCDCARTGEESDFELTGVRPSKAIWGQEWFDISDSGEEDVAQEENCSDVKAKRSSRDVMVWMSSVGTSPHPLDDPQVL